RQPISPQGATLMVLLNIAEMYGWGNFLPQLPKTILFFRDTLCESCDHGSVKTLRCRPLLVVDQLQHTTKSSPFTNRVIQFSASSAVGMLPSPPCLPPRRGEGAKSPVNSEKNRNYIAMTAARRPWTISVSWSGMVECSVQPA